MTAVSAGRIILTTTQPVGSRQPHRGSNPPLHQESRALPTELLHASPPPLFWQLDDISNPGIAFPLTLADMSSTQILPARITSLIVLSLVP